MGYEISLAAITYFWITHKTSMQFPFIETLRLKLLMLSPKDIAHVFAMHTRQEAIQFFGFTSDAEYDIEKRKSDGGFTTYRTKLIKFLLIEKSTGVTVGTCSFHNWYPADNRTEIGYNIYRDADKQKGLMSEAVARIIDYGFLDLGLQRIEAMVDPENIPSLKIMARHQFKKEGVLRKRYNVNGVQCDAIVFSILKDEYNP